MQILSLLAPLVIAAAVAVASSSPAPVPDLTHVLAGNKNLTSINELIHKYGDLYATLSFTEGITLLAPSNDAFNKIPYSALRDAFETNDTAVIRAILDYHVINGTHTTASFSSNFQFLPTWLNNASYTNVTGGAVVSVVKQAGDDVVFVSGEGDRSSLSTADILYTGGVIQVIDTFLIPPETFLSTVPTFNLTSAGGLATKAKLDDYLDTTEDLTIFAPSNDALEGIGSGLEDMTVQELAELFSYHVVNGTIGYSAALPNGTILKSLQGGNLTVRFGSNSLYVNSAKIIQQDILLANGVMHVIDNVLDPNDTYAYPNPVIPTQPAVLPGSAVTDIPFSSYLPSTISSFSSASPTGAAASSSFGVSDIGAGASSTLGGGAASTAVPTGEAGETGSGKKKKSAAARGYGGGGFGSSSSSGKRGWVVAAVVGFTLGFVTGF